MQQELRVINFLINTMNNNPYRLDYFILRNAQYSDEEYALEDHSRFRKNLTVDFYYYNFYHKLFIEYSGLEYLEFLKFQMENSEYGYGLVAFLKEDLIRIKEISKTEEKIEFQDVIAEIMKKTNSKKLFAYYGQEILIDPELKYSKYYFEKFVISNKEVVKLRIKELSKLLKVYSKEFFVARKKIVNQEIIDVEELETKGQKVMLLKELGVLDFLAERYCSKEGLNVNQLSGLIHCFTGLGASSVQSMLNPIFNACNNQKNNPYQNENNLLKIKSKLAEIKINL